ncbi:SpoIIE family protein phosphatase [Nonomuraea sp. 3-1Str]|uniref:SpoIIE family protein phosphatase n=1 Tax=Nonomuraea sp. 3-1Str TaxID=2929801 RepID=UPI00285EED90|nr:SpoIIE family protein phosphatase [Nonomuraea sp. 3-1Str]MDR8414923.1 SpoIIE family protein phosphatase [Nonomuraea sp. 3-1Str]
MHDSQQPADEGTRLGRLAATVERLRREVREAHAAADGRALIELAKGILVERLGCNPAEAARQLAALAEQTRLTQLELAADIVNQAAQDRLTEAASQFVSAATGREGAAPSPGGGDPGDSGDHASIAVRLRTAESGVLAADDTQTVSESLLQHALSPLGATAVAVWAAGTDGSLTLAGAAGFAAGEAERWRYVPPGVATPARQALVERGTVWFADLSEFGLPSIGHQPSQSGGRVTVPAGTGGRILGVLEIAWTHRLPPQPQSVQRQVEALAELIAHTLEGHPALQAVLRPPQSDLIDLADGLHDPALVLRPHLDADGRLVDFLIQHTNTNFVDFAGRPRAAVNGALLLEAYPMAAGEGGLFEKVERVHATGEAFRTERMQLTAIIDQVPLTAVANVSVSRHGDCVLLVWRVLDEAARVAGLLQHAQRLGRMGGFEENVVTGEITWNGQLFSLLGLPANAAPIPLQQLPRHAHPDDGVALGRFLRGLLHHQRPASTAFRLRRSDGVSRHIRVVAEPVLDANGRLLCVRGAYQDISAQHWTEVALAATRDQLAHSEQQAAERNRLALQLQQAIMPPTHGPIEAFDLRIGVRYRPAEEEALVGGDWYDCVVLPSKQVLLSLGDVAGHGIEAATGMVVLRNALRGLATTGAGPAQLLTWLNLVAHHLTEQVTATAVCALFDPETRVLRWARAGHFPPIMVRDGESSELPMIDGVLLGALSEARYDEGSVQLLKDDVLLMYTDGLIERKDRSLEHSQRQLLTVATAEVSSLEQRLDHLLTYSRSDTDDDTCVIGIQLR